MSYEYFFHTPRYKQLDKRLIEEKVQLLPHAFECTAKDGSRFYIVVGDEETKNFVRKMVESDREHLAVLELVDAVTIECDEVCVSIGLANEALRIFEMSSTRQVHLRRCFRRWLNDEEYARVAAGDLCCAPCTDRLVQREQPHNPSLCAQAG